MSTTHVARLPKLHLAHTEVLFKALQGTPLLDANDRAVLDDSGKPIYLPPTAAVLKEVREFLKDNGIDSEPIEGGPVESVAKKLKQFDGEPLFLEESGEDLTPPEGSEEAS